MASETASVRVLIVAAYASVRAGLHALLADEPQCVLVGEVSGSLALERLLPHAAPDVVLCDSTEEDGGRVLETLAGRDIGLVLLADDKAPAPMLESSSLPGYALLRKDADGPELAAAIRAVAVGLTVLDRTLTPRSAPAWAGATAASPQASPAADPLTVREREVLQLMAQGLPNKQIASRLNISPHTAKFHVASVLAKLGAASRAEAVTLGARRGDLLL